jgi:formylglycine-generating enzyme required for sulfatase activity
MKHLAIALLAAIIISTNVYAQEKRIALVIGNAAYTQGALRNPVNDANLMETTLKQLGFTVIKKLNVTKYQFELAVQQFSENLGRNNVALFYYAGHGMQSNGINYLIPIDAKLEKENDLKYQAVNINFIVEEFQQYPQNTNIVILDACRDNPLASWARSGARGFKAISPSSGTIIAFATAEGNTASDGEGSNGLFTSKLVAQMRVAQPIETVFKNTRVEVIKASGNKQSPQEWSMLTGNFQFVKGATANQPSVASTTQLPAGNDLMITEEVFTGTIKITSELEGDFYFDGVFKGKFNKGRGYTLNNIEVGNHTLKVGDWETTLTVERDKTHEVLAANLGADIAFISGGSFTMGSSSGQSDETPHTVSVGSFSMMKHEVTVAQFKQFIDDTGYQTDADKRTGGYGSYIWDGSSWVKKDGVNWKCGVSGSLRPQSEYNHPVIHVSWNDAMAYAQWLSRKTGKTWRLPTEAEWEFAARGGTSTSLSNPTTYAGSNSIDEVAWYSSNSGSKTQPVGQKKPNGFGLYDMSGNVWEWCADWYSSDYYKSSPSSNPLGPSSGSNRVLRGGGWSGNAGLCRVSYRYYYDPEIRSDNYGFRLVLVQ